MVTFDLGAVLSVTTGILLCPIGDVYEILNFLTGDNLFTHQLLRAEESCKPHILQQHPGLKEVDTSGVTEENWEAFLLEQKQRLGDIVPLVPLDEWKSRDAVEELVEMVGEDKATVVCPNWPGSSKEA